MADIDVTYQVYAGGRWLSNVTNAIDYAGIYGTPIQGVYANLSRGSIQYRTHVQGGDWLPWVTDRIEYAGIIGKNVDGIQMKLVGLSGYTVSYRAYVGGRWLSWVKGASDYAGLYGQTMSGIQIEVVPNSIDYSEILRLSGNRGLFSGLGMSFPGFDVWKAMTIISVNPTIAVQCKVGLQPEITGSTIDLAVGANSLTLSIQDAFAKAGIKTTGFLTQNLVSTLQPLTLSSSLDRYMKISVIGSPTLFVVQLEASLNINGVKVYDTLKITVSNPRASGGITVPIAQAVGTPESSKTMSNGEILVCAGLVFAYMVMVSGSGGALLVYAPVAIKALTMYAPKLVLN